MNPEPETVILLKTEYDRMVAEAKKRKPQEACGLVAGYRKDDGEKVISRVYILRNTDESAVHFSLDPKEQLAAVKDMRAGGLSPLGNWHSHPETPSRPSDEDKRLAYDSRAVYLILSLAEKEPVLSVFLIEDGNARKEILLIEENEEHE